MPEIHLKLGYGARMPEQSDGDVGFDIFASMPTTIPPRERGIISTSLYLADEPIITGSCINGNLRSLLKIESRSGLAYNHGVWTIGGIIDPSYRGEIKVIMFNSSDEEFIVSSGMKIAQLVWYPVVANWAAHGKSVRFVDVDKVKTSTRGAAGFGSTGV